MLLIVGMRDPDLSPLGPSIILRALKLCSQSAGSQSADVPPTEREVARTAMFNRQDVCPACASGRRQMASHAVWRRSRRLVIAATIDA